MKKQTKAKENDKYYSLRKLAYEVATRAPKNWGKDRKELLIELLQELREHVPVACNVNCDCVGDCKRGVE